MPSDCYREPSHYLALTLFAVFVALCRVEKKKVLSGVESMGLLTMAENVSGRAL